MELAIDDEKLNEALVGRVDQTTAEQLFVLTQLA